MITFSKLGSYGQLGNQMFQYAMLLGVAARTGYEVAIPRRYTGQKKRGLVEFKPFQISAKPLMPIRRKFNTYHEKSLEFDPGVFEQPDFTDYLGYYQSEKYFSHVEETVRKEFQFDPAIESYVANFLKPLRKEGYLIAVHVRRGDYLENPQTFHVLSTEYYGRAMNHSALPENKVYVVFSDDRSWCQRYIPPLVPGKHVLFPSFKSHWHDLCAMTLCEAHIIAASSFSWWGAWLCHNRPNVVIAPDPWFPKGSKLKNKDQVPDDWIKMPVYNGERK